MKIKTRPVIGIIGGVGPYAGLDLVRKIFDSTIVRKDQDHLDLLLASCPRLIPDSSEFLLGKHCDNPASGILACIASLYAGGARLFGIPCNTAHSESIMDAVRWGMIERYPGAALVDMLEETARWAGLVYPQGTVGLLATKGTYHSGVYGRYLESEGLTLLEPSPGEIDAVHRAIFDREWGLKACSDPPTERARATLADAAHSLLNRGARAIIMGFTEIPQALKADALGAPLIDAGLCLARALVRVAAPEALVRLGQAKEPKGARLAV
jgi:aspartate racemase